MLHAYRNANITFLRAPILEAVPGIIHAFSTRRAEGGDLSLGRREGRSDGAESRFMSAAGLAGWPLARLRQVHSNLVHAVGENAFANDTPEGDAAHTAVKGLALGVVTADCVPILVADRGGSAVAAAHAGWRGTAEGVARKTVDALVAGHGLRVEDLSVAIGPHIGVCCMEVGEEVVEWFGDPDLFQRRPEWDRPHLDLAKANRMQLIGAGVRPGSIQTSTLCTRCRRDLLHSYRRDGEASGRMLAVIGIEP